MPLGLGHARSRRTGIRNQRPLLIDRLNLAPLHAQNNRYVSHRTLTNIGAESVACNFAQMIAV